MIKEIKKGDDPFYQQTLRQFMSNGFELKSKSNKEITSFYIVGNKKKYDIVSTYFNCDIEKTAQGLLNTTLFEAFCFISKISMGLNKKLIKEYGTNLPN